MKKILFLMLALIAAMSVKAQKITVLDNDGNGIPYATVLNSEGEFLGTTSLEGVLADTKGAKSISISHVAFKTKDLKLDGKDVSVVLEDADFSLDEILVSPKPFTYVQTYYRVFFYESKHGIVYYRAGLTDNVYDRKKDKVKSSTQHFSIGFKSIITKIINTALGWRFDKHSEIRTGKREDGLKEKNKDIGLKITQTSPGHWTVSDFKGTVGSITDDKETGRRFFAIDSRQISRHRLEAKGKMKELAKREEYETRAENEVKSELLVYQIDAEGNYSTEDFVMEQFNDTFDYEYDGEMLHCIIGYQEFATDRAYVTKDELKQRQKENKIKMTYSNLREFEKRNDIPAITPIIDQAIGKLINK